MKKWNEMTPEEQSVYITSIIEENNEYRTQIEGYKTNEKEKDKLIKEQEDRIAESVKINSQILSKIIIPKEKDKDDEITVQDKKKVAQEEFANYVIHKANRNGTEAKKCEDKINSIIKEIE